MNQLDLSNKRVLIRADLNVPLKQGKITSDARIQAALPGIKFALSKGAKVLVMSHLGRPVEGVQDKKFSLLPVANYLSYKLGYNVPLIRNYFNQEIDYSKKKLAILENVRFNLGEASNEENLAKKYAALCDIFVMDAFATAHRAQASTHGIMKFAHQVCAGPLLARELDALSKAIKNPTRPIVAIVGGSKVSTKLSVLNALSKIVDCLIVGGGIANTFIASQGYKIGKSLYEPDFLSTAKDLSRNCHIPMCTDVRVANTFSEYAPSTLKSINEVLDVEQILDIGDDSIANITKILNKAKTILWNGPIGVFEFPNFRKGTAAIANAIANSKAFSIAGGGDTIAAIDLFKATNHISYISTGGGAFLEFIEGKELPAVSMLEKYSNPFS